MTFPPEDRPSATDRAPTGAAPRLAALYGSAFVVLGASMPFLPVWLEAQGVAPEAIGAMLALPILVRILLTAPLMSLVDRGLGIRPLLVGANLALGAAYLSLTLATTGGPAALALAVALAAAAQVPIIPASDLLTLTALRADGRLDYGRIRLWGSVAFLVANIAVGHLVGGLGPDAIVWILAGLATAGALVAAVAVPGSRAGPGNSGEGRQEVRGPSRLPRRLIWVIAAAACTQASHAAVYGFGSLLWQANGFSGAAIGWLWAIGVVAEIAVFALLGRSVGPGRGARALLTVGSAAAIVRAAGLAAEPGLLATALLQALHGLTFGATHLGAMAALARLAPEGGRGRAQGVLAASTALATAGATVIGGFAYRIAGPLAFLAMVPLAAAGFLIAMAFPLAPAAQPQRAGEGG